MSVRYKLITLKNVNGKDIISFFFSFSILDEYSNLAYCPDGNKLPFKLKQSDSSAFCAILPNFPQAEFTVTKVTAQTQTNPQALQKAQTGIAETNGHAE